MIESENIRTFDAFGAKVSQNSGVSVCKGAPFLASFSFESKVRKESEKKLICPLGRINPFPKVFELFFLLKVANSKQSQSKEKHLHLSL